MQARYYDPAIGCFYSNDPVDSVGHIHRDNPVHGFNRNAYANNNPFRYTDPYGNAPKGVFKAAQAFTRVSSGNKNLDMAIDLVDAGWSASDAMGASGLKGGATVESVRGESGSAGRRRAGRRHTRAAVRDAKANNAAMNGGVTKCTTCSVETTPTTKGSTVAPTEGQGGHTVARTNGGNGATVKEQSNINIKCAACNNEKSDK